MFSYHVLVVQTVVRHSDTVARPAELVLHYHCLNTSSVGLHEGTGIGAAIFPSDTKYLSEAMLVAFLLCLQMTTTCNPRLAAVDWQYNRLCRSHFKSL